MSTDLSELSNYRRTLSGEIPSGSRAITLQVSLQSSFSGLLRPGDRVDVILLSGASDSDGYTASIVLQNALVLAIGQTFAGDPAQSASGREANARAVTLQIGVNDGQRLAHARREGRLLFLLRNGNDEHVLATTPQIGREDIEVAARRDRFLYRDRRRSDVEAALATATAAGTESAPLMAPPAPL